jgi:glycosyltransferase involved in cell wall biosynthesis
LKSYTILPIYNRGDILDKVLLGIAESFYNENKLICILDGCTDNSEAILRNFILRNKIDADIYFMNDVHEITCLNYGLMKIKLMSPDENDLIFTVQDDVILEEKNIDKVFENLYNNESNLGYVSMRFGVKLLPKENTFVEYDFIESEFGHWKQLNLSHFKELKHLDFVKTEIAVRSPTCVQWKRYAEIGFYDPFLAPCGFDCHDFSIRMNKKSYVNGVYSLKYTSKVDWGNMRKNNKTEVNSRYGEIYDINRIYLRKKHEDYFRK